MKHSQTASVRMKILSGFSNNPHGNENGRIKVQEKKLGISWKIKRRGRWGKLPWLLL